MGLYTVILHMPYLYPFISLISFYDYSLTIAGVTDGELHPARAIHDPWFIRFLPFEACENLWFPFVVLEYRFLLETKARTQLQPWDWTASMDGLNMNRSSEFQVRTVFAWHLRRLLCCWTLFEEF